MIFLLFLCMPFLIAGCRVMQKGYTICSSEAEHSTNIYVMITSFCAMFFFAAMAGFDLRINLKTFVFILVLTCLSLISNFFTLKAIERMNVVTPSVFSGAGAMIIPFLYGSVFLRESVNLFKVISFVLLLVVVVKPLYEQKNEKGDWKGYLYCLILFVEAGLSAVQFKIYATATNVADSQVLCFWANAMMFPFVLFVVLGTERHAFFYSLKQIGFTAYLLAALSILMSNGSVLLEIYVLKYMNLTLYTLLKNPILLIMTALFSCIFLREKMSKKLMVDIALSVVALVLSGL